MAKAHLPFVLALTCFVRAHSECIAQPLPSGDDARKEAGGIANMDALISNNDVLTYAWGPPFGGHQIMAWGYSESTKKISFWYAKPDHILKDKTNGIGMGMKMACKSTGKCPDLEYWKPKETYGPGGNTALVELGSFGSFNLNKIDGRWRFTKPGNPAEYLDHVYSCSKSENALVFASAQTTTLAHTTTTTTGTSTSTSPFASTTTAPQPAAAVGIDNITTTTTTVSATFTTTTSVTNATTGMLGTTTTTTVTTVTTSTNATSDPASHTEQSTGAVSKLAVFAIICFFLLFIVLYCMWICGRHVAGWHGENGIEMRALHLHM
eukprot:TRINITY_DN1539_c0_g2_i1.p1 TRINITY_DN1539_c0_g2~~TRINITY_DN1539_c0_g2_i1.p1  ORF type:complete len:322 (+),score=37.14 TRINITY_DN1539_c0_g2_i1:50-1015(+)